MRRPALLLIALLAFATLVFATLEAAWAQPPQWAIDEEGYLVVTALPPVLEEPEIEENLTSLFTTSFVLRSKPRSPHGQGGALIEVRHDGWREVFEVLTVAADGEVESLELESLEELRRWWRSLRLRVFALNSAARETRPRIPITLEVPRFSHAEQLDARRWILERTRSTESEGAGRPPEKGPLLQGITDLLMATSIGRQTLLKRVWRVELAALARAPGEGQR